MQGTKNLTEGVISRQLFNLAMPIMGTSFIQMAYSITDMAWVGRLGSEAVAAIGAVGILTWMTNSISYLNKVGSEVSVGQSIGAQNVEDARGFASHNLTIALILSLCWGFLLFVLAHPIIGFYKLEEPIALNAVEYLRIVASAFPFIFLSAAFTGIHNAAGLSKIPFYISGTGLLLNMVLDPLFILGFHLGLPVALLNTFFAIINLFMARTASTYGGHIGLMTLTAGGQMEAIAWNTSQGFSTALSAFTAQNYAARKKERILTAYHTTLKMTSIIGVLCTLLFVFYGSEVFSLIVPEQAAYEAGGIFLRIDGYSMIFMMLEITTQGMFYGTGRTVPPAIISISCNTLRIPLAIGLAAAGLGITGVWWAISLSSMLKGIVAFIWFSILQKKIL